MTDNKVSVEHPSSELNCPSCGSAAMVLDKAPYHIRDKYIGEFEAIVCKTCKYSLFTPAGYDDAMLEARKRGLIGPPEETVVEEKTSSSQEQQLIVQESNRSVFILQFTEEAPAEAIKDQYNRYINMKFIKNK
jgi:hypothetical protein